MKSFNELEEIKYIEELDKEIQERTSFFDKICLLTMGIFITSGIFGITTYGWWALLLGIFSGIYALSLSMNIHLLIQQKNTYIQLQENSEKMRTFMFENFIK